MKALPNFSIIWVGPFYRLQQYFRLINEENQGTITRALVFALVTWLPLVIVGALQEIALNDEPRRSLLLDLTVYTRFLLAVPLLILAENVVDERYSNITAYFLESGIVRNADRYKYLELLESARRLCDSALVEAALIITAFVVSILSLSMDLAFDAATWHVLEGGSNLSLAGWWYALVGFPFFHFLLYRWAWRLVIWCIFLWRFSKLNLQLIPTHPDLAGGLGILSSSFYAFIPLIFAVSSVLSSAWAMKVFYEGASVHEFRNAFFVFLGFTFVISAGPLLIFIQRLLLLKLRGQHEYGVLANQHSILFDEKWIQKAQNINEVPLGNPDMSSLIDLNSSYQMLRTMRIVPFGLRMLMSLAVAALIPMIPLILTEIPLRELIQKVAGALL